MRVVHFRVGRETVYCNGTQHIRFHERKKGLLHRRMVFEEVSTPCNQIECSDAEVMTSTELLRLFVDAKTGGRKHVPLKKERKASPVAAPSAGRHRPA